MITIEILLSAMQSMYNLLLPVGGIVRVCGLALTPRIILMTDGEPSDSEGTIEVTKTMIWP